MSATWTIARKELRALFQSPIAIIFLSVFLILTLFLFFTQARFFARGLADVRPLFEWLPLLLIFLVSAITMRSWAEERKAGTLEVLLTLPIRTVDLVLGKFFAGMVLVAAALLFTLPLPFTVWLLGPLDWGPVAGGYFAALMLGSAYMAIGLCVSARTDNQVVALMVTLVLGGLLWLAGTEMLTAFFTADTAEILRAIGTGSRFESIERGVFDLRDIVYYTSLTAVFLVINGVFLEWERLDTASTHGRARSGALLVTVALVLGNALAANLWLAPIYRTRVDLTANRDYTISPVTKSMLQTLPEPLRLRGFFSEKTHPMLAPLVPQIRDILSEYEVYGGDKVYVEFLDPNKDEQLEGEINELYSIQSVPFSVADRHSQAVVNAYFHLVVAYGDKFEVLEVDELLDVRADANGVNVKLKNLEYDLTRAIRKVSQDFETLDSLVAKLPAQAQLTAYITPGSVPPNFLELAETMRVVGKKMSAVDPAKVVFTEVDPSTDAALAQKLAEQYAIQPLAADLFGTQRFYLHMLLQVGDHFERIMPRGDLGQPELERALESAFRRAVPGQLKKMLLVTEEPKQIPNPQLPPDMQLPPPPADYRAIEQLLGQTYTVERSEVADGYVPEDVDVVVVGKMGRMNPKQQFALDQFLMRGGSIIALTGSHRIKADRQGMRAVPEEAGLLQLLEKWGVKVESSIVMSDHNAPFPVPAERQIQGGPTLQTIELIPYPFFPDLRGEMLNSDHASLAGVSNVTMPWSSPLTVPETLESRTVEWLLRTDEEATLREGGRIEPERAADGSLVWAPTGAPKQETLAVAVSGKFPSFFADLPNPLLQNVQGADNSGRTLKASVSDGRLVVIASSESVSDLLIALASQIQSDQHSGNIQLLQNLIDWTLEDTELLSIRTGGAFARTLRPLEDAEASAIEIRTWLLVLLPVLFVVAIPVLLRRSTIAIPTQAAVEAK